MRSIECAKGPPTLGGAQPNRLRRLRILDFPLRNSISAGSIKVFSEIRIDSHSLRSNLGRIRICLFPGAESRLNVVVFLYISRL